MEIQILDILKFRKLNTINLGLNENEVVNILGKPEDKSKKSRHGITYKYDNIQFHFNDSKLTLIGIYFYNDSDQILFSDKNPISINKETTVSKLTSLLDDFNIVWSIDKNLTYPEQAYVNARIDIKFFFDNDLDKLEKIIIE